jgi:hypothetical protein
VTAVDEQQGTTGVQFLSAWDAKRDGLEQPATPVPGAPAPAVHGPRPRYVAAAIADEARQVRQTPEGQRNAQLNTSAVKLGRLIAGGMATEEEVREALSAAARDAGLGPREIHRTISSGLRAGTRSAPRDPGPMQNTGNGGAPAPVRELVLVQQPAPGPDLSTYLVDGVDYLDQLPENPDPIWGAADHVLWADGEALMIAGGPGLGKTTLAGQLVRARLGLQPALLGLPVVEGARLLYLMMDRPQQIARRLRQQLGEDLAQLRGRGRLVLGIGPPPQDMARHPELLADLCAQAGADTVVVDSLKDAAIGLTDDEVGAGYNRARQLTVTAGVQVLELHHLVKRGADGKAPTSLADVYGSAWLTAGAGSVLLLSGDAGSPIVRAAHLKPVAEPWGPADLSHDHRRGVTTVHHRVDLLQLLAITGVQTARTAACQLFDTDKPKPAETERARRKLEQLVAAGRALSREKPGSTTGERTYHPLTARELELPAEMTLEE